MPLFTRPSPPLTIQRRNLKEDITPSSGFPRARLVSDLYLSVTEVKVCIRLADNKVCLNEKKGLPHWAQRLDAS